MDKGVAEVLYVKDLTVENIYVKILLMMSNPKYKKKIQMLSERFRDQKETPLQRAVWWIEWTIRNPIRNDFDGPKEDLNFLQIESVDVISFLTIVCGILLYVSVKITTCMTRKCLSRILRCR